MAKRRKLEGRHVCKCECGGEVRGVKEFGRLWTWCEECSPVVTIKTDALNKERAEWLAKDKGLI